MFYLSAALGKSKSTAIEEVTESSISITWNAPSLSGGATNITGYLVTVMPDNHNPSIVQGTTTNITGLISNMEYTISVAAIGSDNRTGAAMETTADTSELNGFIYYIFFCPRCEPVKVSINCSVEQKFFQV